MLPRIGIFTYGPPTKEEQGNAGRGASNAHGANRDAYGKHVAERASKTRLTRGT
ncbi:MAG: hypothetical protein AB8B55_11845 [Mariniblastus sp.]